MGTIFFIFKVNTVEKVLRDLFQKEIPKEAMSILMRKKMVEHLF